jgi:transposase
MLYVGLDVHSNKINMTVIRQDGQVERRCQMRSVAEMIEQLKRLPGPFKAAYEASCAYGLYYEVLTPLAQQVVVAHPGRLHMIFRSKRKNDRNDADWLARLLLVDAIPAVHVPAPEVQAWRELITFRRRLAQKRTRVKNALRALLRTVGVRPARKPGLWTHRGLAWLRTLPFCQLSHAIKRDLMLDELAALTAQVARVEKHLDQIAENNLSICQLQSVPGIGPRTAEAIVAFVDDPHRFRHSKSVGSYFGLVPCQDQSGSTNRLGHITREGSATVRHLLTEAVWRGVRKSPTIARYFARVQREDPDRKKIAIVATAHYLIRVMWAMLKNGTLWRETHEAA